MVKAAGPLMLTWGYSDNITKIQRLIYFEGKHMKNRNGVQLIGSFVLLMCFLSCGGCGNSNLTTGPGSLSISNLSPTNITLISNSTPTTVTVSFDATGENVDLPMVHVILIDNSGQTIRTYFTYVSLPPNITDATVIVSFSVDTSQLQAGTSGSYEVYMTDTLGKSSNLLSGLWSVT